MKINLRENVTNLKQTFTNTFKAKFKREQRVLKPFMTHTSKVLQLYYNLEIFYCQK